jgi:predicted ATPase
MRIVLIKCEQFTNNSNNAIKKTNEGVIEMATARIKISELAKTMGVSEAQLLALCRENNVPAKNSYSTLVEAFIPMLMRKAEAAGLITGKRVETKSPPRLGFSGRNKKEESYPSSIDFVQLSNFKSIENFEVQLSPLTVVIGANSSGKSSLLQALLLLIQHVTKSQIDGFQISLNQHLVRLGTFDQVKRFSSKIDESVCVGIGSQKTSLVVTLEQDAKHNRSRNAHISKYEIGTPKYLCEISDINDPESFIPFLSNRYELNSPSASALREYRVQNIKSCRFHVFNKRLPHNDGEPVLYASYDYLALRDSEKQEPWLVEPIEICDLMTLLTQKVLMPYSSRGIRTSNKAKGLLSKDKPDPRGEGLQIAAMEFIGQLLGPFFRKHDPDKVRAVLQQLSSDIKLTNEDKQIVVDLVSRVTFAGERRSLLDNPLTDGPIPSEAELRQALSHSFEAFVGVPSLDVLVDADYFRYLARLEEQDPTSKEALFFDIATELQNAKKALPAAASEVFYLGPIRDPEAVADPISNPRYVGSKGEQTVEIIEREADRKVIDPWSKELMTFNEALSRSLQRFEIANSASMEQRGRERPAISINSYGENDVKGESGQKTELNAVGVGVSQILPVIAQCLLANPGKSLVIVEQPELHLHPRLEQILGDFFIACIRSGRRLLIETHSEHLVNRLRLRIAEDLKDELSQSIKILFAEQQNGVTHYQEHGIDKDGTLAADWPEGFFDLSAKEARELLEAAIARRREIIEKKKREIEQKYKGIHKKIDDL